MNWFKRLCLFVFGLSGILSLVALSLVWVGPWTTQARTLITENRWYFIALEVLVCISALGLLWCVLKSLFAPRNPKQTVVADINGNKITVTRTAISSQTKHIIEADGSCAAVAIRVRVRRVGNVRVFARVRPHVPIDVVKQGEVLYGALEQGLAKVCGDSIKSIDLVFTEPEQQNNLPTYVETDDSQGGEVTVQMSSSTATQVTAGPGSKEITVMRDAFAQSESPAQPEAASKLDSEAVLEEFESSVPDKTGADAVEPKPVREPMTFDLPQYEAEPESEAEPSDLPHYDAVEEV